MSDKWGKLSLSQVIPSEATDAIKGVGDIAKTISDALNLALDLAKTEARLVSSGNNVDLVGVAVSALTATIEGLLQAGKLHVLFVPVPRSLPAAPTTITLPPNLTDYMAGLGFSWQETKISFSEATAQTGTTVTADSKNVTGTSVTSANNAYAQLMSTGTGGNKGFYRTVASAMYDLKDPNRPAYESPGDYIACAALVAGTTSFYEVLQTAAAFNAVFRPPSGGLARSTVPVPANLKVMTTTLPRSQKMGVRLDWDPPRATFSSPYFPGVSMRVTKYAVIRTTDKTANNAHNVIDLLGTSALTEGLVVGNTKVVAIGSGGNASYVDEGILEVSKDYYYCVAWKVTLTEGGKDKELPWDLVSAVRRVDTRRIPPNSRGVPPDWTAYGSAIDVVPDVSVSIKTALATLQARATGASSNTVIDALTALQKNTTALVSKITTLSGKIQALTTALQSVPSVYATEFHGVGGDAFLLGELAIRLTDATDKSRPPFDGNEYVIGVVIVAGGPRQADVSPAISFLNSMFGTTTNTPGASTLVAPSTPIGLSITPQGQQRSALSLALSAIEPIITQAEQIAFSDDLKAAPSASITANAAPKNAFAENMLSVDSTDPANPRASETGVAVC